MKIGLSNPFNYTGSKHRYLKDLQEVLPNKQDIKVCDMFFGGGDLSTHLPLSWEISGYDTNTQLIDMHKAIMEGSVTVSAVEAMVERAKLNKVDNKAYNDFRAVYNWARDSLMLYVLTCHSNSNRIRFNSKGEHNMPFGKRTFNDSMKAKLTDYIKRLSEREVFLYNKSVFDVDLDYYDLLLVDPPYLNSCATYNEKNGWTVEDEIKLHLALHEAHEKGKKFTYFGQVQTNGIVNKYLTKFAEAYNMKVLKDTTSHCSANKINKGVTIEVMIYN